METTIQTLVQDYQNQYSQEKRIEILKGLIEKHGINLVSQASGYGLPTLVQIEYGYLRRISLEKVLQAEYVFNNLN